MSNKVKEALGSASYLTYHWRQYSFEQLEKEMVRVCGLCHNPHPAITAEWGFLFAMKQSTT